MCDDSEGDEEQRLVGTDGFVALITGALLHQSPRVILLMGPPGKRIPGFERRMLLTDRARDTDYISTLITHYIKFGNSRSIKNDL